MHFGETKKTITSAKLWLQELDSGSCGNSVSAGRKKKSLVFNLQCQVLPEVADFCKSAACSVQGVSIYMRLTFPVFLVKTHFWGRTEL